MRDFAKDVANGWAAAERQSNKNDVLRCHYVPQFVMRRWLQGGVLQVINVATGALEMKSAGDVGMETDLYTIIRPTGEKDRRLMEAFLGWVENRAGKVIHGMEKTGWPWPKVNGCTWKHTLSLFLAVMMVRLPPVLRMIHTKHRLDWNPEYGVGADGQPYWGNFAYRLMKNIEPFNFRDPILCILAESFFRSPWAIFKFHGRRLQTGGIPVSLDRGADLLPPERWRIRMPLSPSVLLGVNEVGEDGTVIQEGAYSTEIYPGDWDVPQMGFRIL
jgi:hypothetical protein